MALKIELIIFIVQDKDMEKHTKSPNFVHVIAGKAVHVKRFITVDEQARFLPGTELKFNFL